MKVWAYMHIGVSFKNIFHSSDWNSLGAWNSLGGYYVTGTSVEWKQRPLNEASYREFSGYVPHCQMVNAFA